MNKEVKELIKEVESQGWTVTTASKSFKFYHPQYGLVFCAKTPSCRFFAYNVKRNMKQKIKAYYASQKGQ